MAYMAVHKQDPHVVLVCERYRHSPFVAQNIPHTCKASPPALGPTTFSHIHHCFKIPILLTTMMTHEPLLKKQKTSRA